MRKLLSVLLLLITPLAQAGISIPSANLYTTATVGAQVSVSEAYAQNVAAHSILAAYFVVAGDSGTQSCSDTLNGSWTVTYHFDGTLAEGVGMAYFVNSAAGADTVTCTGVAADPRWIAIVEYQGAAQTSAVDGTGAPIEASHDTGVNAAVDPGPITTTTLGIIASVSITHTGSSLTSPATNYTSRFSALPVTGFGDIVSIEDFITAGPQTANHAGWGDTKPYWDSMVVAFRSSPGPCTNSGITSAGAIAVPNGSSGSYQGKNGTFVTPDCSAVQYKQPTQSNFGVN